MTDSSKAKSFEFPRMVDNWAGYISSADKTNVAENVYVRGSQNIYKKLSGTLAVRQGQLRQGVANTTVSPCSSEFVWNTSWGSTYTMVISDSKLWVVADKIWYSLLTGLTSTRYVFDKWWDDAQKKDELLFVNGSSDMQMWGGGFGTIKSTSGTAISLKGNNSALTSITTTSGTAPFVSDFNSLLGTSFEGSIVFSSNPTNGQTLILNINGTAVTIHFVSVIGAVAGNVLISGTLAGTLTNLLGLLTAPGTTSATQVALSGGNQTLVGYITWAGTNTVTINGTKTLFQDGFNDATFSTIGSSTTQFDITNPSGTTFRYTWDTTGTDPAITPTTVPVGTYILLEASNFSAVNTGIFTVTAVGTNYFEITNASGLAENNKTIGTGFIYVKYTKVVVIDGVTYAYTGGTSTTTLTGVVPTPSGIVANDGVIQAVITYPNTPAQGFNADFIKVINNQVYVGSYTSNLTYISDDTDFTDYTIPSPRVSGSPELIILGGTGKGIGVRQGNACIGYGANGWAIVSFANQTVGTDLTNVTTVTNKPVALLQAPLAHEFIDAVGDNLIYLSQDQQVREFGDFNSAFVAVFPSLSQEVATELMNEDFTGGGLRCIGEFIYVTAPDSGKTYLRQERTRVDAGGAVVSEKLWHSPFIWNATRVDQIDGVIVVFSNANPQIYEVWDTGQWHDDSPSDEPLPYSCILALSYRGEQRRQGLWSFDKQFTEGYITQGTPLNLLMNYNYQGTTNAIATVINSVMQPAYIFQTALASLGDNSLGDEPLGNGGISDSAEDPDSLPKFKVINSLSIINCFEWQPVCELGDFSSSK